MDDWRRREVLAGLVGGAGLGLFGPAAAEIGEAGLAARIVAETGAPALAYAVVHRSGVVRLEAAGVRRAGRPDPVGVEDKWHLGSNTKAMTAAVYARLVQRGAARWGATLGEIFPEIEVHPALKTATVEQVLSHGAGLTDAGLIDLFWLNAARRDRRSLPEQRLALTTKALTSAPGGKAGTFAYANINYVAAGAVIERLTGGDWESAIRAEVFEPLKIASAGFGAPAGDQPWGHRGGRAVDPATPGADNPAALGPAGTAHMTLADYARWLKMFLDSGAGYLDPAEAGRMWSPAMRGWPYSLGWGVAPARAWSNGPVLTHAGSNTMWFMIALVAPDAGVAYVAASNSGGPGETAVRAAIKALTEDPTTR